jgi:hypothetical protein
MPHFLSRGRPEILEYWYQRLSDLKLLILMRPPDQVAASITKAPDMFGEFGTPEITSLKYGHLTAMFMEAVAHLGVPHRSLAFPDFLGEFDKLRDALENFGGLSLAPQAKVITDLALATMTLTHPRPSGTNGLIPRRSITAKPRPVGREPCAHTRYGASIINDKCPVSTDLFP